jgi:hypothetical protein
MERALLDQGRSVEGSSPEELDRLWDSIKQD